MSGGGQRPAVSVIVPFHGDEAAAERLAESLAMLELRAGDEIIVADNSAKRVVRAAARVRVVPAMKERSSYHARNTGAEAAASARREPLPEVEAEDRTRTEWLVFTDADCVPASGLLDAYFAPTPAENVGALAGTVASDPRQDHLLARYAADRGFLDQEAGVHTGGDGAATANLAVRRTAFEEVGGFQEGIRSGGDVDLCRRLTAAGWTIERRPHAVVTHMHRESLRDLLSAIARYGSGARWLDERYPGSAPQWPVVPGLLGSARDIASNVIRGRFEEAAFRGVDAVGLVAHAVGYRRPNVP